MKTRGRYSSSLDRVPLYVPGGARADERLSRLQQAAAPGGWPTRPRSDAKIAPRITEGHSWSATPGSLPTCRTSPRSGRLSPGLVSPPSGSISTTDWPAPTVPAPSCARLSPLAGPATPWWSPNSTGSPGPCPTPVTSPRSSPLTGSSSALAARSTTRVTRSGGNCPRSWPWLRSSSQTWRGPVPARAWQWPRPRAGCEVSSPN